MLIKVFVPETHARTIVYSDVTSYMARPAAGFDGLRPPFTESDAAPVHDHTGASDPAEDDLVLCLEHADGATRWLTCRPGWVYVMNDDGKTIDRL